MKRTSATNPTQGTLPLFPQMKSQTMTYSLEDSLASLFRPQGKAGALTTAEELYFLRLLGFSKTKDPDILYLKTSKVYLVMTREKLSKQYLGFLPTWGIELNGRYLIAASSGFLKTEKESSLLELIPGATRTPLRYLKRNQKNIKGDYAFTIDVGNTGGVLVNGIKRKLTNDEKELLQGFPKGWTVGSETQRSKQLGNAVTVNVVEAIAKLL